MADIYCSHFEYGGKKSSDYDLIISNVGTERNVSLAGTFNKMTVFNKRDKKAYLIDDDYTESPVTFDVDITTSDGATLTKAERREIEKWLFNKHNYRKLYFDRDDDWENELYTTDGGSNVYRMYLNCRFLYPEKLEYNGGIIGYKATLECDSMMFWQDPMTTTISGTSGIVTIDTDIDDYVYPEVTIRVGSTGGDIIIVNQTDSSSRITKFIGVSANEQIIMKGNINYLSSNMDSGGQTGSGIYEKFINANFVRLLDGENNISLTGDIASVTFKWQNRRFM